MACQSESLFADFSENQIKGQFDEDVRRAITEMESPLESILKSKELKEECNKVFRAKAYRMAINLYDKSL